MPQLKPQQIIKFNTDGMAPVYIDLDQVSAIGVVEITSFKGTEDRVAVWMKGAHERFTLNRTFVKDLTLFMDAWMAYKNAAVLAVQP